MNNYTAIGNITRPLELKQANDKPYLRFTIAINEGKDKVDFIPCVAFGKTAELINEYFDKGSQIGVEGKLSQSTYEDKEGNNRNDYSILVRNITFINDKPQAKQEPKEETPKPQAPDYSDLPF